VLILRQDWLKDDHRPAVAVAERADGREHRAASGRGPMAPDQTANVVTESGPEPGLQVQLV